MTMFLVFWASNYSYDSEDICICKTEEIAEAKVKELNRNSRSYCGDYHYKELEVIE